MDRVWYFMPLWLDINKVQIVWLKINLVGGTKNITFNAFTEVPAIVTQVTDNTGIAYQNNVTNITVSSATVGLYMGTTNPMSIIMIGI